MRKLLVATTNLGKVKEILRVLDGLPIQLKTLADFPAAPAAEETGSTFLENARQKAVHYARLSGLPTMAEDSGFEVDALGGEPGIYSARYLRPDATYPERFTDIFQRARARGGSERSARFVCALVLAHGDRILFQTTKFVEGELATSPAGGNGFGYDPIFFYPPFDATFGEVTDERKATVSHRGLAAAAARACLLVEAGEQGANLGGLGDPVIDLQ